MKRINFLFRPIFKLTLPLLFVITSLIVPKDLLAKFRNLDHEECQISKNSYQAIIDQVKSKNYNALTSPKNCIKRNQKLVFESCLIDPKQLKYAANIFRNNENFVLRLIKVHPEALLYASDKLRSNQEFIQRALFLYRDSAKFASKELLDNFLFMKKIITKDSRNYIYASKRIQALSEIAKIAFSDNGGLILYAPNKVRNDKKLVMIALKSSSDAYELLSKKLRKDPDIIKIANYEKTHFSKKKLEDHIVKNYVFTSDEKYSGKKIDKEFANFEKNKVINRNYVTKWHKTYKLKGLYLKDKWQLVSLDNRNHIPDWQREMKDYPVLVDKIDRFFKRRLIDQNTIDSLRLNYLWKVQDDPKTLAFNLFLLRDSKDVELAENYVNATSLTAIARQTKDKKDWRLTVIEVIFDREVQTDIAYQHSIKKYFIQDLYIEDKDDKNPKVIFRVEDKFDNYFEVFSKMSADKYHLTYRINPDKIRAGINYDEIDEFGIKRSRQDQEEYEWERMMEDCRLSKECAKKIR